MAMFDLYKRAATTDDSDSTYPMIELRGKDDSVVDELPFEVQEQKRQKASFWVRWTPILVIVSSTVLSAIPAVLTWGHVRFGSPGFYDLVTQRRATIQVVLHIITSLLSPLWAWSLCTCFNLAMRSALSTQTLSLSELRLHVAISRRTLDRNLPYRLFVFAFLFWSAGLLPGWLWTGALTPQVDTMTRTGTIIAPKWGQGSYPSLQPYNTAASPNSFCNVTTQLNGTFSNCPSMQKSGLFVGTLGSASVGYGQTRNHSKLDNTGYSFVNRSYGVGASVGLQDLPDLGHINVFNFSEAGYVVGAACTFNQSADWKLSWTPMDDPPNQFPVPNNFWACGRNPNEWSVEPGPGCSAWPGLGEGVDIVAWRTSSGNSGNGSGPFYLTMSAGLKHQFIDQLQCELTFTNAIFSTQVSVANRTIHVVPMEVGDALDDPEPRGMLRQWAIHDLAFLAAIQTNLYESQVGAALLANAVNKLSDPNINSSIPYQQALLPAFEDSVEAVMDDILQSLSAYVLTQSHENWDNDRETLFRVSAIRIGSGSYSYSLFALNLAALAVICVLSIYTKVFGTSPAFDFTDLGAMMAAVRNGSNMSSATTAKSDPLSWNGDPGDPTLCDIALAFDTGLGSNGTATVSFASTRRSTAVR